MNKFVKTMGIAVAAASMLLSVFAFTACGHTHSLTKVNAVEAGCETDGNTEYYACSCGKWYEDKDGTVEITDKNSAVIKAGHKWDDGVISDDGNSKTLTCVNCHTTEVVEIVSYAVTYDYNYEGSPEATVIRYESGKVATAPSDPEYPNPEYNFNGWFTETECRNEYDFTTPVTADITLYAKWTTEATYVFEAEYTVVKGLRGKGYSNDASGLDLIVRDTDGAIGQPGVSQASNGFYISYFYVNGLTLTFNITSDREVDDAVLSMRLSGEILNEISLTCEEFLVKVNDGEPLSYDTVVISDIDTTMDAAKHVFEDFLVSTSLHLNEGDNKITLTVNNTKKMGGTLGATAPLIDCIKIKTTAKLSWNPVEKNLDDYR